MIILKKIGLKLTIFSFLAFIIQSCIVKDFVKIDILYTILMFLGALLEFCTQYKFIKENNDVTLQDRKSFIGLIAMMIYSLCMTIIIVKYFYFP